MIEQIIFLIFAIILLGILLGQICKKGNPTIKLLFFFTLIILTAFYLFQFGELGSFIFSSKWADVKFIKEKKEEARQEVEEISKIKAQIQGILEDSKLTQKEIVKIQRHAKTLEKAIVATAEMVKLPTLSFHSKKIEKSPEGYTILLRFIPSKNRPLGPLKFSAKIIDQSDAKILKFWPKEAAVHGQNAEKITENGKEAQVAYSQIGFSSPLIELKTSKTTTVEIAGSHGLKPFIIEIKDIKDIKD